MRHIPRELEQQVLQAARNFPAVVLTGPRRAGKTWLLRRLFPKASYFLLEDPDIVARLRADPQGFLDAVKTPAILDEVQNVPEVFAFVRSRIDRQPRRAGQWLLTGSQESPLMQGVTESMAGRAAVLQLLPLSARETPKVSLLRGGYPEVLARPAGARLWFSFVFADLPGAGCPGGHGGQGSRDVPPVSGAAGQPPRAGAEQDRSGRAAGRQRADHRAVARRAGDDRAGPDRAAVLRESRQTPDQVAQGVSRRFRPCVSSAGHRTAAELPGRRSPALCSRASSRRRSPRRR